MAKIEEFHPDFNPRCPCGQRLVDPAASTPRRLISIHAAHAGSDFHFYGFAKSLKDFNPRCPCGQRRNSGRTFRNRTRFQSTLPMRAATGNDYSGYVLITISIHAAHAGSDTATPHYLSAAYNFNPRCPCGQRLGLDIDKEATVDISIHAAHAGSD